MTMRIAAELARARPVSEEITVLGILSTLLRRKHLIGLTAAAGIVPLLLLVVAMRPLYVSEAMLELNFNREEVTASTTVSRQMASMDPGALVNGAAHRIASRATAIRVARQLGLDKDATNRRHSALLEERAVDDLMRNIKVSYKAHLYLIGISYSARDPQVAADYANAFAIEYLRGERLKELTSQRGIAQSELLAVSEKLGPLHPRRLQIETRIKRIDDQITKVSISPPDSKSFLLGGQYLTPAEPILTPASQKRMAILAVGLFFVLVLAALVALLVERFSSTGYTGYGSEWMQRLANLDART